jgi:hypothetical protein
LVDDFDLTRRVAEAVTGDVEDDGGQASNSMITQ